MTDLLLRDDNPSDVDPTWVSSMRRPRYLRRSAEMTSIRFAWACSGRGGRGGRRCSVCCSGIWIQTRQRS